jgi:uncharacterized protein
MFFFDPLYLLLMLPGLAIAAWAQFKVKGTYAKYQNVRTRSGLTGADVAHMLLQARGLGDVTIEPTRGFLSDHYDPRNRVLRLSEENYRGNSVSAIGVAAHEAGHAIQHADRYKPLEFRSAIVPAVQFGSSLAWIFLFGGMFLAYAGSRLGPPLLIVGLACFALALVFSLVTLPVEINASRRALALISNAGILQGEENDAAREVLKAAAYTYVAAVVVAALQFLYYALRVLPLLTGGRRD